MRAKYAKITVKIFFQHITSQKERYALEIKNLQCCLPIAIRKANPQYLLHYLPSLFIKSKRHGNRIPIELVQLELGAMVYWL